MSDRKQYADDDGRTIADMSNLDNRSVLSGVVTGLASGKRRRERSGTSEILSSASSGNQEPAIDKSQRRSYIFGAMGAGLLIGGIFLAAFAVVIVLMLTFWSR